MRYLLKFIDLVTLSLKRCFLREVLVLGDSHALVFHESQLSRSLRGAFYNVVSVGGATVSGLDNPNSKTQAMPVFKRAMRSSKASVIIVLLGEVDTGFVIWYRSQKYGVSVQSMLDAAIGNYQKLLLLASSRAHVVCVSAPLPTIRDGVSWGEVANARREVRASQKMRTDLTLKFNATMRDFCHDNGINYLSLDSDSLGEDGLVSPSLLNSDSSDHHYDQKSYSALLLSKIRGVLDSLLGL